VTLQEENDGRHVVALMPEKKQYITTVILLLLIAGVLAGASSLRGANEVEPAAVSVTVSPVAQGIDDALRRYEKSGKQARSALQTSFEKSGGMKVEMVFCGTGNADTTASILSVLNEYGIKAVFYVSGSELPASSVSLQRIAESGQMVGITYTENNADTGVSMVKRTITDLVKTSVALHMMIGLKPTSLLTLEPPNEELLAAAYASLLESVLVPTETLQLSSGAALPDPETVLHELPRGAILCLQLNGVTQKNMAYLRQLCAALVQTDHAQKAKSLLASPYYPAQETARVYTTERAAALTFSGFDDQKELSGVLAALASVNAKATFFVSSRDLAQNASGVKDILQNGHALGIAVLSTEKEGAEAALLEILQIKEALYSMYAYAGPLPVRPAIGGVTDALRQACGAGGFTLLTALSDAVHPEDERETDPAAVLEKRFPRKSGALQRGEIVHFRMGQYHYSSEVLGGLVRLVAQERNIYALKPVMEILSNQGALYTYPLKKESILPEIRDAIHPGQLIVDPMTAIQTRYFGIFWVNVSSVLPGFTQQEINRIDKKGLVANNGNMVFLTFDDWGTDATVTGILDVLRKHGAKATFFVRTNNVHYNPNLLRAIALEGHSIASHTHSHFPLSNSTDTERKFTDLTEKQAEDLKRDLVTSYEILQSLVGDIKIDGRPALTRLFRPPTLAVSKRGLTAVFELGFTHSVSGSHTTNDYEATDPVKLANELKRSTRSGAVMVMHMSDNSIHTAEALDIYLSQMETLPADKAYRFVSLAEVLK